MALNTITPSNREEEYLSAIAGDAGASAPVPSNRREEWLRRIAEDQGDQTERLDHIEEQLPVDPVAADVGKVMTVVADTSGETPVYKWSAETPQGGAGTMYIVPDLVQMSIPVSYNDIQAAVNSNKKVVLKIEETADGSGDYSVYINDLVEYGHNAAATLYWADFGEYPRGTSTFLCQAMSADSNMAISFIPI